MGNIFSPIPEIMSSLTKQGEKTQNKLEKQRVIFHTFSTWLLVLSITFEHYSYRLTVFFKCVSVCSLDSPLRVKFTGEAVGQRF